MEKGNELMFVFFINNIFHFDHCLKIRFDLPERYFFVVVCTCIIFFFSSKILKIISLFFPRNTSKWVRWVEWCNKQVIFDGHW